MLTAGTVALLVWSEWLNRRWSRTLVSEPGGVLGYDGPLVLEAESRTTRPAPTSPAGDPTGCVG